jgi:ketosteroid isomerase-like protein
MNKQLVLAAAIATTLLAAGCAKHEEAKVEAKAEAPAVDLAAEQQAIRTRSGEWMNYANAKDAASIANGVAALDALFIDDGKAYKGTAAIQARAEAQVKESPNAVVSWTSDEVRVANSGDLAVELGSFNFDPDGEGKEPAIQGSFATTWVKTDGQWRVLSDAGGENPAPAKP